MKPPHHRPWWCRPPGQLVLHQLALPIIFYLFYAVVTNTGGGLDLAVFLVEGIVLLIYKNSCPLTVWARQYSNSTRDNFDIYIPNWLARYNKTIFSGLLGKVILILILQLIKG